MIGHRIWPPGFRMEPRPRFTERDHLIMPRRGWVAYGIGSEQVAVRPGEVLFIPAGLPPHAWWVQGDQPWEASWLQLRLSPPQRSRLRYAATDTGMLRLPEAPERNAAMEPIMTRLLQLAGREGAEAHELRQLLVRALLQEIVLFHGPPETPRSKAVARALDHLDRHLADHELSLADLVRAAGCARSVLVERFTRELGQPPMRYLEGRRLDLAADWLQRSQEPIAAIAAALGYPDSGYFATRFRRRFQCSPRLYRARA